MPTLGPVGRRPAIWEQRRPTITVTGTRQGVPQFVCEANAPVDARISRHVRVMVFVDFWNFQLLVNGMDRNFQVDWQRLGPVVAQEALGLVDAQATLSYQGMNVYGSYDPSSPNGQRLLDWARNFLARQPGVQVTMLERQRKLKGPVCPACHEEIAICPKCAADFRGTEEKGVDTRIATDMIKLAWVDNYDVAVLVSSDGDFVPVVDFLSARGIKAIHAAFPPQGVLLSQSCWGNISLPSIRESFRRS